MQVQYVGYVGLEAIAELTKCVRLSTATTCTHWQLLRKHSLHGLRPRSTVRSVVMCHSTQGNAEIRRPATNILVHMAAHPFIKLLPDV
jgi:hypothetical protein